MGGKNCCDDCCLSNICFAEKTVDTMKGINEIEKLNLQWMMLCLDEESIYGMSKKYSNALDSWKADMIRYFKRNNTPGEIFNQPDFTDERNKMRSIGAIFAELNRIYSFNYAINTLESGQEYVKSMINGNDSTKDDDNVL